MNFKLVLALSLFGLAMGIATVYVVPSKVEPILWLVIFVISAWAIARTAPGRPFLHGLATGLANSVWITGAHVLLYDSYVAVVGTPPPPFPVKDPVAIGLPGAPALSLYKVRVHAVMGPWLGGLKYPPTQWKLSTSQVRVNVKLSYVVAKFPKPPAFVSFWEAKRLDPPSHGWQ